jgi:quinohemoprotein ethanol dehydrogenase
LKAWNPVSGKLVWQTPGKPYWGGGVLSTASGLVFQGGADGTFTAYDGATGHSLLSLQIGTGIMAAPISYELDGAQYVAVMAGFGGAMNAIGFPAGSAPLKYVNSERLLVFKLDGTQVPLPPARVPAPKMPAPEPIKADDATITHGREVFINRCASCHGYRGGAFAGAFNGYPDLWNLPAGVHNAFQAIVLEGALSQAGMPSFKDALNADDVHAIQAFIVSDEIEIRRK